ncbi:NAD(P)-dependent dehydrogenase (short-subunit alcohol dehydrogenase family) [Bradyrhizobium sp. LM3.4]
MTAMVDRVMAGLGPIDILVNNAGIAITRGIDDLTEDDFDRTILVNLKSVFLCTQAVLPTMRAKKWGRIVNISSGAARGAGAIGPHYNASKAGLEGLTRGYAARLVKEGVTVNAVAPSLIETDMMSGQPQLVSRIPLGRFGHGGRSSEGRDASGRQRLHDRADGRAQRRHGVQLGAALAASSPFTLSSRTGLSHMKKNVAGSSPAAILRDARLTAGPQDEVAFRGEMILMVRSPPKRASRTMQAEHVPRPQSPSPRPLPARAGRGRREGVTTS